MKTKTKKEKKVWRKPADWLNHDQSTCDACSHGGGSWGPGVPSGGTHCSVCGWTWTAERDGHCERCHHHFGADDSVWDRHLVGGVCTDPGTIVKEDGTPFAMLGSRDQWIKWSSEEEMEEMKAKREGWRSESSER